MCGRFYIPTEDSENEIQAIIEILQRKNGMAMKRGEIFPSDIVPVIANNARLQPTPFAMKWGYSLQGKLLINARSETAGEKPLFRDSMKQRRCLVPAAHYFEWERRGKEKTKYQIRPDQGDCMYMAGLYRKEEDHYAFIILTRAPAENISFIHDRMPVIIPEDMKNAWLDPRNDADDLLRHAVTKVAFHPLPS